MARPRQRRKVKNPTSKLTRRTANRLKKRPAPQNSTVPDILLPHFSNKETMGSNYERWGLVARVNGTSGGKQRDFALALDDLSAPVEDDEWTELDFGGRPVAQVASTSFKTKGEVLETALVQRDEDGNIIAIESFQPVQPREEKRNVIVEALENRSKQVESRGPPGMADYEIEYIDALIAKHGDDFIAMSRDIKRNFNQCTPTQLKRKVEKYQAFMNKAAN